MHPAGAAETRDTRTVDLPTTLSDVIARLREIDAELPTDDGVAVFNRMYLTVTERIAEIVADPAGAPTPFRDSGTMAELDVTFANLWLAAYDADASRRAVTPAWRPLFQIRGEGRLPVQYAIAGMNTHIEHDLPIAVVGTCRARGLEPGALHADYQRVNQILAQVESPIRRSFLDTIEKTADDRVGPVVHVLSTWDIDKARDIAWVTAETIWALGGYGPLRESFLAGLGRTVGMTSRALLTPIS